MLVSPQRVSQLLKAPPPRPRDGLRRQAALNPSGFHAISNMRSHPSGMSGSRLVRTRARVAQPVVLPVEIADRVNGYVEVAPGDRRRPIPCLRRVGQMRQRLVNYLFRQFNGREQPFSISSN